MSAYLLEWARRGQQFLISNTLFNIIRRGNGEHGTRGGELGELSKLSP
jgi:hypothetical protein